MAKLKKIDIFRLAKFQSVLLSLIGLIAGVIYSFGGALYDFMTIGINTGTVLAFLALVGMPLLFAATGFIIGIFEAILLNI